MKSTPLLQKIRYSLELVKFSHTVFALPFALASFLVASRGHFRWETFIWVLFCVLSARTAAMAFNRLVDARIDAQNPRTKDRHLPKGLISRTWVLVLTLGSASAFLYGASRINSLAFLLSPLCLALLLFYSLTKRFTHFTQFFLGLALGMAPVGAAIAAKGRWDWPSLLLGTGVLFWVAGFDLLYALQDLDFDRSHQVFSLPVKLGVLRTFLLSRVLHALFIACLLVYGIIEHLGSFYFVGTALCSLFLIWEHRTLKRDLNNIQAAFFTANGLLSLFFLAFISIDVFFP